MILTKKDENSLEKTVEILKKGGIVIIPTDTVYGFSGIVDQYQKDSDYKTDNKIRLIKGRAETKPLIQLISEPLDIYKYTDDKIPSALINKWPGPLTIIVNLKKSISYAKTNPTVAFRCPDNKWLREVIKQANHPIFSTSVNRSGSSVLETIKEIKNEFEKEVDLIIDDGEKKGALPSTLVKIENEKIIVLRQGEIKVEEF